MEGKVLAGDLIRSPNDWYHSVYRYRAFDNLLQTPADKRKRYAASSVVAIGYGRRIIDTRTDAAYQKLVTTTEFMTKMNVPGAQCTGNPWLSASVDLLTDMSDNQGTRQSPP